MDEWRKDARRDVVITDIDALVPEDHLLRKIEKVMDYDWLYERLDPYYNHEVGRPGTDPVTWHLPMKEVTRLERTVTLDYFRRKGSS